MTVKGSPAYMIEELKGETYTQLVVPLVIVELSESNSSWNVSNIVHSVELENPERPEVHHGDNDNVGDKAKSCPNEPISTYQDSVWENQWQVVN